jgi:hypothetical protein
MASRIIAIRAAANKTPVTTWGMTYPVHRVQRQPLHFYYQKDNQTRCNMLDCNTFVNQEGFTINYDEEHLLLPNCNSDHLMIYHADTDNGPVTVDSKTLPVYMCFNIRLSAPGMSLNVGPDTQLSLLLQCTRINIIKLLLTKKQIVELSEDQNVQNNIYTDDDFSDTDSNYIK